MAELPLMRIRVAKAKKADGSTNDFDVVRDLNVGGDADVEDDLTVGGDIDVTGDIGGATATITGNATVGGTLGVTGNTTLGGNLSVSGNVTGTSIVENMSGYSFGKEANSNINLTIFYAGAVKNGNKLTLVAFGKVERTGEVDSYGGFQCNFRMPESVRSKIVGQTLFGINNIVDNGLQTYFKSDTVYSTYNYLGLLSGNTTVAFRFYDINQLTINTEYVFRFEKTFLLSDSLVTE